MSSAVRQAMRKEFEVEQPRELLRIEEAAEVMGMSARHVRRLVAERRIAFH